MVYGAKPLLFRLLDSLPLGVEEGLCIGLTVLILTDTVISATVLSKLRKTAEASGGDDTEAITRAVRQALTGQNALLRRLLRAFPDARLYNKKLLEKARQAQARVRRELKETKRRFQAEMRQREIQWKQTRAGKKNEK